ncbi:MAG: serine acetyltransferase [Phycisphaerae bacterium]|jgi:serine O-acetyltransferase|nr:serine acetyltransferase [Phycisphaerae bacterium]MBT6282965.1 serine acetyltransferase [Phycisphaerae bacterium]
MTPEIPHDQPSIESPLSGERLDVLASQVADSIESDQRIRHFATSYLPSRREVIGVLERLSWLLFPGFNGPRAIDSSELNKHTRNLLAGIAGPLFHQIAGALRYAESNDPITFDEHCPDCDEQAREIVDSFLESVPALRESLSLDVQAAFDGDPAAQHTDETIFCYPGIRALWMHRVAHALYKRSVPLIPRIISEHAHELTGIDIHPGATIGESFFIDHGTGVVIGETTVIGNHCKVYQGVTLGARSFERDESGELKRNLKRHPTLGNKVTVYAGATILGGDTTIGDACVIAGGVFLVRSVDAGHTVRGPKAAVRLNENREDFS